MEKLLISDIVSRGLQTPKQQSEAWNDVKNTILEIFLVVIVGYNNYLAHFCYLFEANTLNIWLD